MARNVDHELMASECQIFSPFTEEQKHRARLQVCINAKDIEEAADLLMMLGLFPGQSDDMEFVTEVPMPPNTARVRG